MTFSGDTATTQAKNFLYKALKHYATKLEEHMKAGSGGKMHEVATTQGLIDSAAACLPECQTEPRFWRPQFRTMLYQMVVSDFTLLCQSQRIISEAAGEDHALQILREQPREAFDRLVEALTKKAQDTVGLVMFILKHPVDADCTLLHQDQEDLQPLLQKLVEEFVQKLGARKVVEGAPA